MRHLPESNSFSASGLSVRRGRRQVLEQVSLQLRPGQVLGLLGANGAGKSTLLSALAAEIKPQEESSDNYPIVLNGQALSALSAAQQARSRTVLPQKSGLAFDLQVAEVIAMGAYPFPGLGRHEIDALTSDALQRTETTDLAQRRYLELSGGEQQRVQFARVVLQILAQRATESQGRYMLLDEPTASLDPLHQQALLRMVVGLSRSADIGVLVILHDVNLAALWCDRIALLAHGGVLVCGEPMSVLTAENLKAVYDVGVHIMPHPTQPEKPLVVFG
ncbi:heme ABC transporter ATP-binding protein [Pusillimonas sp. MFBS29]|uniref:heme ABC transporter ATP-binding protein n=1 Tax=Pusillimonas sp. MFBS29 TaxID=2886690 RepID=UPI001D11C1F8|nr:heme ABC transporter ATP-binding protein [Pusillimonas sp. MFBS29]MCC2595051.1 heme ABC transporter ATP-binding protein [Pusillimonas sp. MFBS29]